MTKSLLTEQDIKNFILESIEKARPRKEYYFVRKAICRKLGLNEMTFKKYMSKGLTPDTIKGKRKYFNINKVIQWLDEHNIPVKMQKDF